MLNCCNCDFRGSYCHVLCNRENFYRRIEYGICPKCNVVKFLDYRLVNGKEKIKILSGVSAENTFNKIYTKIVTEQNCSKSNQNFYYGDFKSTGKKDLNGNPVYLQLRKNFNGEADILGEVKTKVIKIA